MPFMPGMRTSIKITSGSSSRAWASAWPPSAASPATARSGSASSSIRRPSRTRSWSSAIRTLITTGRAPAGRRPAAAGRARRTRRPAAARRPAHRRIPPPARASRPARARRLGPRRPDFAVPSSVTSIVTVSWRAADRHVGAGRAGVLEDVGQRLLDDPVDRHVHGRGQRGEVAVDDQVHRQARGPDAGGQRVQVADARLRGEPGLLVRVAQDAQQAAGLGQCLPGAVLDLLQGRLGRPARRPGAGRLQHDHAEVVGDDVVQFPGDPRPLGRRGLLGLALQRRAPRGQRGGLPAGADENAGQPERRKLQQRQCHVRRAALRSEDQPQLAVMADHGHDRDGEDQARRPRGAGWRARPASRRRRTART